MRGVYTADPRLVSNARQLTRVSFDEMLEMASSGAGVLATRSIEVARSHNVRLHVRSTFEEGEGTWIQEEDTEMLEKALISGVVHQREETVYRVDGARPAQLFGALARAAVNVDTIVQRFQGAGERNRAAVRIRDDAVVLGGADTVDFRDDERHAGLEPIRSRLVDRAVQALHEAFELG